MAPPQPVAIGGGFDYVTVDPVRRRVYAAHSSSQALLIVDADSGKVIDQVRVGPLHGVAVDPLNGHVYTGDGDAKTVSDVDPESKTVVRTVDVPGIIDAVVYDPDTSRIFADEDDGTRVFVIDSKTFKRIATIRLPGHKPEYLAVDPATHDIYQNIADMSEFVVIDGTSLRVKRTVTTPELGSNHPLQYDPQFHVIVAGGNKGTLSSYDPGGKLLDSIQIQPSVDQCDLDRVNHVLACAGSGALSLVRVGAGGSLTPLDRADVARGVHTVGLDPRSARAWIVWAEPGNHFVQGWNYTP